MRCPSHITSRITSVTAPAGWTLDLTQSDTGSDQLLMTLTKTELYPGESATASFTAVIDAAEPDIFEVVNRTWASFDDPCGNPLATPTVSARIPLTTLANETAVAWRVVGQLDAGARALMLDLHLWDNDETEPESAWLCHGECLFVRG